MGKESSMAEAKTPVAPDHDRFDQASTLADGHNPAHDPKVEKIMEENAKLANPLAGLGREKLLMRADEFIAENDLQDMSDLIRKGALVAGNQHTFEELPDLTEEEKAALRMEHTNKWKQTKTLYALVICCSMAAVVQGQDQSLINAANIFFPDQFGIGSDSRYDTLILGLVNAAPYFACVAFACWLTDPLNRYFGRKGTILITLVFAAVPCIWAGLSPSWQVLMASRIVLSIGIGPKSATVPVYAAETAPPAIRGSLVMMWQMWTAFGIMIGYVCGLIFYNVSSSSIEGLNWRLMLGSGCVPPIIVFFQVLFLPESPRWLLQKRRTRKAYQSLVRLRNTEIEAARDLFYISQLLKAEDELHKGNRYVELFSVPRNRRAALASFIVMFMQQFCGINVIAYYSSRIFVNNGFSEFQALLASFGFGAINWLFAIPAIHTIDRYGRRTLLLIGFPLMAFWLAFTGAVFYLPEGQGKLAAIAIGIYFFAISYSPSEGPVPFTYSAECFPLYIRPIGMAWATAICWGFNGILAFTWPLLEVAFTTSGAFFYYAAWNLVGFTVVLLFLPETAKLSLEELDMVFSVPTRKQAQWGAKQPRFWFQKYILRKDVHPEPLYEIDPSMQRTYVEKSGGH